MPRAEEFSEPRVTTSSSGMVTAALAGDDTALVELIRRHHKQPFRFAVHVCGNSSDADDAVQEALITLARRPDMQGDPVVIRWMFTVVKNWCLRLLRRSRARAKLEVAALEATADPGPEVALEEYRVSELVRDALARLEQPYKEVVVLRDLEGLPGERVCAALNISEAAMKSRLHRARASLRKSLAESVNAAKV